MNRPANPPIDKRELRRWAAQRRAALGGAWRASAEAAAAQRAIELIESRGAKTVALFTSFGDEIDTHGLIRELLRQNIRVALPRVVRGEKRIELSVIHQFPEDLAAGTYGILEPDPDRHGEVLAPAACGIIFVPGLLFARSGWRLGYGGGYYDRLLQEELAALTAGFCFSAQIVENLPHDDHDRPVGAIVTDHDLIEIRGC